MPLRPSGLAPNSASVGEGRRPVRRGLEVEIEHGARDPQTNVTNNDMDLTGKIAWAHLKEFPDYYTRLDRLEAEADAYWSSRR